MYSNSVQLFTVPYFKNKLFAFSSRHNPHAEIWKRRHSSTGPKKTSKKYFLNPVCFEQGMDTGSAINENKQMHCMAT